MIFSFDVFLCGSQGGLPTPSSDSVPSYYNFNQAFDALSADLRVFFLTMGLSQYLPHNEYPRKNTERVNECSFLGSVNSLLHIREASMIIALA